VLVVFAGVLAGMLAWNLFRAGRQPLIWGIVAITLAVLFELPVRRLTRWMPRGVAIVFTLFGMVALVGLVGWGLAHDVSVQLDALRRELPAAAKTLEASTSAWGNVARRLELSQRIVDLLPSFGGSPVEVAQQTAAQASRYFLITILLIFFLIYGPRMWAGFLAQQRDRDRRVRVANAARDWLGRVQGYLIGAIAEALAVGGLVALTAWAAGLPAPTGLGFSAALFSFIPYVGVVLGSVPVLLLAGVHGTYQAVIVALIVALLQASHILAQRQICRRTVYVGPAIIVIGAVLGYTSYGVGGALFGLALAVAGSALAEVLGTPDSSDDHAVMRCDTP
jgi:predicted PurR-regulated permease PerM